MSSTKDAALELLKDTSWFGEAPDSLLQALAEKMVPVECEDGYLLIEEGEIVENITIIEYGTLQRTKSYVKPTQKDHSRRLSLRKVPLEKRTSSMQLQSVVVDEISGRACVTGLLHNMQAGNLAFATVMSKGPAKVWLLNGADFRDLISSPPEHSLAILQAMSQELRSGSKSLRSLIHKVQGGTGAEEKEGKLCRVLCYDTTSWVSQGFEPAVEEFNKNAGDDGIQIKMEFTSERLSEQSATYAAGYDAVCLFVNDNANADVIQTLSLVGVKMIAMRCAGFDRVDQQAARAYGLTVARVPAYSPYAVAEMAVALLMGVNRKIARASARVKMANFSLDAGLLGMDIHGKTVGVMGTGKIGQILCNILLGFGAKLICYDVYESDAVKAAGGVYVSQDEIFQQSDVLFLMMPLLAPTYHTINMETIKKLKKGMLLINTSRGGLVDTKALLKALQQGTIKGVGMDVYENEAEYFFQDWSARNITDPDLVALIGNNNVVLTAHQAFFTQEAVDKIVSTTLENVRDFAKGLTCDEHPNNCLPKPSG